MDRGWLKIKSAAQWADMSPKTIRAWLADGLPHVRVRGTILIKRETLDAWLQAHEVTANQLDQVVDEVLAEVIQ